MQIISSEQEDVTILAISGSLDAMTADDVSKQINLAFEQQRNRLVIDLDGVEFMSSAGLRAIHSIYQMLESDAGESEPGSS